MTGISSEDTPRSAYVTDWQQLPAEQLEQQFNPRLSIADATAVLESFAARSAALRPALPGPFDISYGADPLMTMDVHQAVEQPEKAPLVVFIHGGYWRTLDKAGHDFVVAGLRAMGFSVINVNYPLCPAVTLTALNEAVALAIEMIDAKRASWGLGTGRLVLMGHSAGAHAIALAAATPRLVEKISGLVAISGIYDPAVVRQISVQADVRLAADEAQQLNLLARPPLAPLPCYISVGGAEPGGWIGQSLAWQACAEAAGCPTTLSIAAGANHFSLLDASCDAGSSEGLAICRFIHGV